MKDRYKFPVNFDSLIGATVLSSVVKRYFVSAYQGFAVFSTKRIVSIMTVADNKKNAIITFNAALSADIYFIR